MASKSQFIRILKEVVIPIIVVSITVFAALVLVVSLWLVWYKRSQRKLLQVYDMEDVGDAYMQVYSKLKIKRGSHEKEFPFRKLVILRELGVGAFGVVLKAEAYGISDREECTVVAVKQLRPGSDDDSKDFLREVNFMSSLDHPNIVRLLGMYGSVVITAMYVGVAKMEEYVGVVITVIYMGVAKMGGCG